VIVTRKAKRESTRRGLTRHWFESVGRVVNVAIGSIFRNSEPYAVRYARQVIGLVSAVPQHNFRLLLSEGDSSDRTWELLNELFPGCVEKREHHGPLFGSVDNSVRWKQSSWVWEEVLARIKPDDDAFIYLESDLIWEPATMFRLLDQLVAGVDVVCPMCWSNGRHYDTWGLRGIDGVCFGSFYPYHSCLLKKSPSGLYPISSAGSCLVMRGEVARNCHFVPDYLAVVGFCQNAREHGYKLWLDPRLGVNHPRVKQRG
jgi:hypothetical protein